MTPLFSTLKQYYDSQEWKYDIDEEREYIRMRINMECVDCCTVHATVHDDYFIVHSVFPIKITPEKRPVIAEYLTRANYGLTHGNFEMDFDDGEVRYKVTTLCGNIDLDPKCMEKAVDMGYCMLDRYGKGLLSVLYGNVEPEAAIHEIEGD